VINACPIPGTGSNFLSGTLRFIDCAAQELAGAGYRALSGQGASGGIVMTVLLTLFVAAQGLRLMGGQLPTPRELLMQLLKLGLVLMLAGSWNAYRVLVHDVVLRAPAGIVAEVARGAGLAGDDMTVQLQQVDAAMLALARAGSGLVIVDGAPVAATGQADVARTAMEDDTALAAARIFWLAGVIGVLGTVRLLSAVLLALGPLFAGLLLFDATRGLFMAWARLLAGCLAGLVAVMLVLQVELALLLPWLANVLALRRALLPTPAAPVELLVLVAGFALMLLAALRLLWVLALAPAMTAMQGAVTSWAGSGAPSVWQPAAPDGPAPLLRPAGAALPVPGGGPVPPPPVADSLPVPPGRVPQPAAAPAAPPVPLGQLYRRRPPAALARRTQGRQRR
jgi:type IV secretion system protein VirB6